MYTYVNIFDDISVIGSGSDHPSRSLVVFRILTDSPLSEYFSIQIYIHIEDKQNMFQMDFCLERGLGFLGGLENF